VLSRRKIVGIGRCVRFRDIPLVLNCAAPEEGICGFLFGATEERRGV